MAQYTDQELARLQLGYMINENPGTATDSAADRRERELRKKHKRKTARMREELAAEMGLDD